MILTANTDSNIVLTLSELSTSTGNTYTLKLINDTTKVEATFILDDISTNPGRFNQFSINAPLEHGRYTYYAYDSNNVECETGICIILSDVIEEIKVYDSQVKTINAYKP